MIKSKYIKTIIGTVILATTFGGIYLRDKEISRLEKKICSIEKELEPHYELIRGRYKEFYVLNGDTLVKLPKLNIKEKPYQPKPDNRLRWHSKDAENYFKKQ